MPKDWETPIIKRLVFAELAVFIAIMSLALTVLLPRLENQTLEQAGKTSYEIAAQINMTISNMSDYANYIVYSDYLNQAVDEYLASPDDQRRAEVEARLRSFHSLTPLIRGLTLQVGSVPRFHSGYEMTSGDRFLLYSSWYDDIVSGGDTKNYSSFYTYSADPPSYTLAYLRSYQAQVGGESYTLMVFYNADRLIEHIQRLTENVYTGFMLVDADAPPFLETGELGGSREVVAEVGPYTDARLRRVDGYYFISAIPSSSWQIVGYIDTYAFYGEFIWYFVISLLLCLLLCGITSLLFRQFKANVRNRIEWEANEQKMKYNLLFAQSNSHFIYNTMNVINSLARTGRYEDIVTMNSALIKILQNSLRIEGATICDSLGQECETVRQYWLIEKLRYKNFVTLEWNIDEAVLDWQIPKNIIQPLVENSLTHGLADVETGEMHGVIRIEAFENEGALVIRVSDNGIGIPSQKLGGLNAPEPEPEPEPQTGRGLHIGLANMRRRLAYLYKSENCMEIRSGADGTVVEIILPRSLDA